VQISLAGKSAIVTGAASGIGLATVEAFLGAGIEGIVAVDVAAEMPQALATHKQVARLVYIRGDVSREETAVAFTAAALERSGRIDVLVNNAGISVVKALHEHTPEEWDRVLGVNAKAIYLAARHVVPVMIKQKSGIILNTGSISGVAGITGQGAYAASKGALHQMTRQMAIDYAVHGIRVNTVGCGTVDTPIVHNSAAASGDPDAFWTMLRSGHPIGRIAQPREIAGFFTYLASDWASFFTGAVLMMDGGYTAR
jgi:NAD(P)-dependent dehydrogenase (short-subunit alcohol dehydrogenase family)